MRAIRSNHDCFRLLRLLGDTNWRARSAPPCYLAGNRTLCRGWSCTAKTTVSYSGVSVLSVEINGACISVCWAGVRKFWNCLLAYFFHKQKRVPLTIPTVSLAPPLTSFVTQIFHECCPLLYFLKSLYGATFFNLLVQSLVRKWFWKKKWPKTDKSPYEQKQKNHKNILVLRLFLQKAQSI